MLRTALNGYERSAVDAFLRRCVRSLGPGAAALPELAAVRPAESGPRLDAGDVRAARFDVVLRGYDAAQVDALLQQVAAALPDERQRPAWPDDAVPVAGAPSTPPLRTTVRGYDTAEVDAFLSRCAHTLNGRLEALPELAGWLSGPRTGAPVRARDVEVAQFHVRARGYDIAQVDALLDRLCAELDEQESTG